MALETTVFDFKISKTFQEWASVYDSDENKAMLKAGGITPLYRGLNKKDSSRAIVVFQAEAGVWRDDFEDKRTNEWKGYNEDRAVEKWWIERGTAIGEIFMDGFMSLWLTGNEDWNNYSLSCRAKLIKQKNNAEPYFGLTLYDTGQKNTRYLFFVYFNGMVAIVKSTPEGGAPVPFPFVAEEDIWYDIEATVKENLLEFKINGEIVGAAQDTEPLKSGQAGLVVSNARVQFDDVAITGEKIPNGGPGKAQRVSVTR